MSNLDTLDQSAPSLAHELNDLPLIPYDHPANVKPATIAQPAEAPTVTESDTVKFLRCVLPPANWGSATR
jgi:hypothetical protein